MPPRVNSRQVFVSSSLARRGSLAERIIRTRGADVGIEAARGNPIAAQCLHATCVLRRPIRRYNHVFSRPTPEAVLAT